MSRSIDLHARGIQRPLLEGLFWFFTALAVALGVFGWRLGWLWLVLLSVFALGVLIYGGLIEPRWVRIATHRLGEGERKIRLVFLSDLHAGVQKGSAFYQRIADRVEVLAPDMVVLGGDMVDKCASDLSDIKPLLTLHPPLGFWFVLGNHDFFDDPKRITKELLAQGAQDLTNQSRIFTLTDQQSLEVIGLDDSLFGAPDLRFVEKPKAGLRIVVMHEPDLLLDLPEQSADLVLLGHTHGGQIRLPLRGPVLGLPQIAPQYLDAGEKDWRKMRVIISRGIGESLVRARLGSRPEIVVVDVFAKEEV